MARFFFPPTTIPDGVATSDWIDWRWQVRHGLVKREDFAARFELSPAEDHAFAKTAHLFQVRATPYYVALAGQDQNDPIRRILVPTLAELETGVQQMKDPLAELRNQPVPRLLHRYSDRVLLLITDLCSVYCRFCTRKHFTGQDQVLIKPQELERALDYIRSRPGIREVLLSGGDPLTIADGALEKILKELRRIDHVEIIRIGTRMPVVAPMRITDDLVRILRAAAPVYLMAHFNHPRELTAEAAEALARLVDGGVPVLNQMVLLNGVNNHAAVVQALSRRLLYLRVKPYYMFQCDPSIGTDHLRTSIEDSLSLQRELSGHLSGLATPVYACDIPGGGGKALMTPRYDVGRDGDIWWFEGWDGVRSQYVDPPAAALRKPVGIEAYEAEWEELKRSRGERT